MILNFIDVLCELLIANEEGQDVVIKYKDRCIESDYEEIVDKLLKYEEIFIASTKDGSSISCKFDSFDLEIHLL